MNDGIRQLLLLVGVIALMAPFVWPNTKGLALYYSHVFSKNPKLKEYDMRKFKKYIFWVLGLSVFYAIYDFAVVPNYTEALEYTGIEILIAAAGLVEIILVKKPR
jgi:hypothetical protein